LTFGRWEGLTWQEVRRSDPKGAAGRERDKWGAVPPDGESYAMLTERVKDFLPLIRRDTVLVSHGGVARALMAMIGGIAARKACGEDIWQGRVLVFSKGSCRWFKA
jgi:broad specificity phosphatase PhoE